MEAVEGNMKRQRLPLSDPEDDVLSENDGHKRRRLQAAGQENCSPMSALFGQVGEDETQPDRVIVPCVRPQVQQLPHRRVGVPPLALQCLSHPGPESQSIHYSKSFEKRLLAEGEFNQRLERFKVPVSITSPQLSPNPSNFCLQTRSDFICGIQQKLQDTATPSSKQVSRIRKEREQELSQLPFQPVSENAWLKRSRSDPSQLEGDADISFTEAATTSGAIWSFNTSGEETTCVSEVPEGSTQLQSSDSQKADGLGEREHRAACEHEGEHMARQHAEDQTLQQLSFSEDHGFSKVYLTNQNMSNLLNTESNNIDVKGSEHKKFELMFEEEAEGTDDSLSGIIESSTDEELRMWRYPEDKTHMEDATALKLKNTELFIKEPELWASAVETNKEVSPDILEHVQPVVDQIQLNSEPISEDSVPMSRRAKEHLVASTQVVKEEEQCTQKMESQGGQIICIKGPNCSSECEGQSQNVDGVITKLLNTNEHLNTEDLTDLKRERSDPDANVRAQVCTNVSKLSPAKILEREAVYEGNIDKQAEEMVAEGGKCTKKVTFILEPELMKSSVSFSVKSSMESGRETMSDVELSSNGENGTVKMIDQMFEEVLEYGERINHQNSESQHSDLERENNQGEEEHEDKDNNGDELLTFPPSGILSPLSKSFEAVVNPVRVLASQEGSPPHVPFEEDNSPSPAEAPPLYRVLSNICLLITNSIDAYRSQRQSKLPPIENVTPALQRLVIEKPSSLQSSFNIKEKISDLNSEAGKLQNVISQTLQALNCCTDEIHGRGSVEEAEAEKLLLVSCEKRTALLVEVARLRKESSILSGEAAKDVQLVSQKPCTGTVTISNIQLPLKMDFVCSLHHHAGRPSHFFFLLIRYGPCNIVATPLATAADAQNGDAISFPTIVTLKDIQSSFEIDVEVYNLIIGH